MGHETD